MCSDVLDATIQGIIHMYRVAVYLGCVERNRDSIHGFDTIGRISAKVSDVITSAEPEVAKKLRESRHTVAKFTQFPINITPSNLIRRVHTQPEH